MISRVLRHRQLILDHNAVIKPPDRNEIHAAKGGANKKVRRGNRAGRTSLMAGGAYDLEREEAAFVKAVAAKVRRPRP